MKYTLKAFFCIAISDGRILGFRGRVVNSVDINSNHAMTTAEDEEDDIVTDARLHGFAMPDPINLLFHEGSVPTLKGTS